MAAVTLEKITKRWSANDGIEDLSLSINDGEFLVLVGPSGCGKSTILRLIAGLELPTAGSLYIGDRLVNQVPARQRDVAMVFQNYALYPHMTVAENLSFGLKMRRVSNIQAKITAVAASLGLSQLLNRKPAQLSGGQQQRVALGRAIIREPQVFLLDEPLSNLDAQLRDDTRAELKLLHQKLGITMVYVTHDQTEAMTLADRVVVLNRGKIQQIGTSHEIYHNPQNLMVATFLGSPPMNILPALYDQWQLQLGSQTDLPINSQINSQISLQTIDCPSAWRSLLSSAQSQPLRLGIRPEHLQPLMAISNGTRLNLRVILSESYGNRTMVRAALGEHILNLEDRSNQTWQAGSSLWVDFQTEHLYLFDPISGDRLA